MLGGQNQRSARFPGLGQRLRRQDGIPDTAVHQAAEVVPLSVVEIQCIHELQSALYRSPEWRESARDASGKNGPAPRC